ncbi:MAG: hypothetical protein IPP59_17275 [Betaproteobacteria bacterium]|nr:hypothetical protein [Candidatus Dechloromonas phosphorivorans]
MAMKNISYPRLMLIIFVLLMVFEGAIRKWIFPFLGTPLQILRDLIPALAFIIFIGSKSLSHNFKKLSPNNVIIIPFCFYFVFSIFSSLISALDSFFVALLGIRTHFAYAPLAILIPFVLKNVSSVNVLLFRMALISVPVDILAIYQSTQSAESWLNIYGTGEEAGAFFGDQLLVRATGTFSYITGMGYYSQFSAITSFYIAMTTSDLRTRLFSALAMSIAIMACFSTGSRAVVFGVVLQIFIMILIYPALLKQILTSLNKNAFVIAFAIILVAYFSSDQLDAFVQRSQINSDDTGWRLTDGFFEWVNIVISEPIGKGLGSGHQQAAIFSGGEGGFGGSNSLPESELSRVALELGILGFLSYLVFKTAVIYTSFRVSVSSKTKTLKMLSGLSLSFFLILVLGGVYSPISNAIYWFSIGLIFIVN